MDKSVVYLKLIVLSAIGVVSARSSGTYRGAVYEHALISPSHVASSRAEALQQMTLNLQEYKKHAEIASAAGVDIMVFPEDGIYGIKMKNRSDIAIYLETMPDPTTEKWTPCDDPLKHPSVDVQLFLSCMAKMYGMYIVVNFGDAQPCSSEDPNCPTNGQYQYNTNVVYDKNGTFIAKYHKQNLFFETQFDEPINPEYTFFDTEFGRFGTFTCFDIIFHEPAIPLVTYHGVTNIVFTTAWMDVLPFFSAIGFHSSFALAHNVNFLAANLHIPQFRFQGSGIYTPNGSNAFYYNRTSSNGKLLISDIDIIEKRQYSSDNRVNVKSVYSNPYLDISKFKATIFHDWYDFVPLSTNNGALTVCQNGFCCHLVYDKEDTSEHFAFGAFNAIHPRHGPYYIQVCIVVRCLSALQSSCNGAATSSNTHFKSFTISGEFSSSYQYPQIILSNNNSLELARKGTFQYDGSGLAGIALDKPLITASIVGRMYEMD